MQFPSLEQLQRTGTRTRVRVRKRLKRVRTRTIGIIALVSFAFGLAGGVLGQEGMAGRLGQALGVAPSLEERVIERRLIEKEYVPQTTQEEKIIRTVREVSPSVVSIRITKEVPVFERLQTGPFSFELRRQGTREEEVGGGTGFIVSEDGLLLTNKHVVLDEEALYTVFTKDGESFPATVLARDPFQDLAVLQLQLKSVVDDSGNFVKEKFKPATLGDSGGLQIGQTVIAIGNALGEFRNTVSVGVISGLSRTITASDNSGFTETIDNVIQTDAAINRGNSGGPLLNLAGEVIGINTATVTQAQSIGFAIPVNRARKDIEQVQTIGKIVYPFLGVQYRFVTPELQQIEGLSVGYGALVIRGEDGIAVVPGSAAEEVGLREGDIILEVNGGRVDSDTTLAELLQEHSPGERVILKILREGEERIVPVTLGEKAS